MTFKTSLALKHTLVLTCYIFFFSHCDRDDHLCILFMRPEFSYQEKTTNVTFFHMAFSLFFPVETLNSSAVPTSEFFTKLCTDIVVKVVNECGLSGCLDIHLFL